MFNSWFIFHQMSLVMEGPSGVLCSVNAHNDTDNDPVPRPIFRKKHYVHRKLQKKKDKLHIWHERVCTIFEKYDELF